MNIPLVSAKAVLSLSVMLSIFQFANRNVKVLPLIASLSLKVESVMLLSSVPRAYMAGADVPAKLCVKWLDVISTCEEAVMLTQPPSSEA